VQRGSLRGHQGPTSADYEDTTRHRGGRRLWHVQPSVLHRATEPVRDKLGNALTEGAREGDRDVQGLLDIFKHFRGLNPNVVLLVENPQGYLAMQSNMQFLVKHKVSQCRYGRQQRKNSHIFSNISLSGLLWCDGLGDHQRHPSVLSQDANERAALPRGLVEALLTRALSHIKAAQLLTMATRPHPLSGGLSSQPPPRSFRSSNANKKTHPSLPPTGSRATANTSQGG
jgi:hypothetical protein